MSHRGTLVLFAVTWDTGINSGYSHDGRPKRMSAAFRYSRTGTTKLYLRGAETNKGIRGARALADPIPCVPAVAGKCSTETIPRNLQPAICVDVRGA